MGKTAQSKSVDIRNKIIGCAAHLFTQKGVSSTTVRDIGLHAGVHHSVIFRFFNNKECLVKAVLSRLLDNTDLLVFIRNIARQDESATDLSDDAQVMQDLLLLCQFLLFQDDDNIDIYPSIINTLSKKFQATYGCMPSDDSLIKSITGSISLALSWKCFRRDKT